MTCNRRGSWSTRAAGTCPPTTTCATARSAVPASIGTVDEEDGQVVLRAGVESLDGFARYLASCGVDFRVLSPDALRKHVAELAARLARAAGA